MPSPVQIGQALVGVAIILIGSLLFASIPLSNVPPASAIMLLTFAYFEEDGMLLWIALAIILVLLLIAVGAISQAMSAAGWATGPFLVPDRRDEDVWLQLEYGRAVSHMVGTPRTRVPEYVHRKGAGEVPGKPTSLQLLAPS